MPNLLAKQGSWRKALLTTRKGCSHYWPQRASDLSTTLALPDALLRDWSRPHCLCRSSKVNCFLCCLIRDERRRLSVIHGPNSGHTTAPRCMHLSPPPGSLFPRKTEEKLLIVTFRPDSWMDYDVEDVFSYRHHRAPGPTRT